MNVQSLDGRLPGGQDMLVKDLDLDAAVGEGIISSDQAERLRELSARKPGSSGSPIDFSQGTRDEPFRFMRGFRDAFIAIGVVIFAVGLSAIASSFLGEFGIARGETAAVQHNYVSHLFVALALLLFGLVQAELITRRQRLPLSSLVVATAFAAWSAWLSGAAAALVLKIAQPSVTAPQVLDWILPWVFIAGAVIGLSFFYWRYRLPSALFLLAGSLIGLSLLLARDMTSQEWFDANIRLIIGLGGLAIFVAAMWFDSKDRLRVSRLSECAFWLHLVAAPAVVHALISDDRLIVPQPGFVIGVMIVLSVIALLIDRRALLVAGLGYFAVAIAQLVSSGAILGDNRFAATTFILGGVVLTLGLGWTPVRRAVLAAIPFEAIKSRLPPATA